MWIEAAAVDTAGASVGAVPGDQWDAERVVDADRAAAVVAEQFPELRGLAVTPLGTGWDNTVHTIGDSWVFRFPRREMALDGIRREIAVLPWLAPALPLAIPTPTYVGTLDGWPFFGAPLIPGAELVSAPEDQRVGPAAAIGRFLRVLHDTAPTPEVERLLPVDPMRRADAAFRGGKAAEALARLDPDALPDVRPLLAAAALGPSTAPVVVTHGDLHARHLLVEGADARGVIDWGDLCLADPAVDVSLAFGAFSDESRAAFFTSYGDIGGDTELRARVLALSLCALLAEYAAADGNDLLYGEAIRGLHRAVGE